MARTRDMGRTWDEFVPPGFLTGENFIALIVNPTDREEAILALSQQAWITKDYGYTWKPFALPSAAEPLTEIAYTGGENPGLVAGTTHAFYHTESVGKSWRGLMRSVQGPSIQGLSVCPNQFSMIVHTRRAEIKLRKFFSSLEFTNTHIIVYLIL